MTGLLISLMSQGIGILQSSGAFTPRGKYATIPIAHHNLNTNIMIEVPVNKIKLEYGKQTSLSLVNGKHRTIDKIELSGGNLPAQHLTMTIHFFNDKELGGLSEQIMFYSDTELNAILYAKPVDRHFTLNYQFCEIATSNEKDLGHLEVYLYFTPPIENEI